MSLNHFNVFRMRQCLQSDQTGDQLLTIYPLKISHTCTHIFFMVMKQSPKMETKGALFMSYSSHIAVAHSLSN